MVKRGWLHIQGHLDGSCHRKLQGHQKQTAGETGGLREQGSLREWGLPPRSSLAYSCQTRQEMPIVRGEKEQRGPRRRQRRQSFRWPCLMCERRSRVSDGCGRCERVNISRRDYFDKDTLKHTARDDAGTPTQHVTTLTSGVYQRQRFIKLLFKE